MRRNITTIQVAPQTRDRVKDCMHKNETYDDFINKLVNMFVANNKGNLIPQAVTSKKGMSIKH